MSSDKRLNTGLKNIVEEGIREALEVCSMKYGFSALEAMKMLNVEVIENKKKEEKESLALPLVLPLPFTGVLKEGCCKGLRQNHGLLTQCEKRVEEKYCVRCERESKKNGSGKPDSGSIEDRIIAYREGKEFRDPKGRAPVAYAKVMKKLKLTESMVKEEALRQGLVLNESDLKMPESNRGRPKKNKNLTTDTDSEVSKKKGRGRPKKAEKEVEVKKTEDLFAKLISEAKTKQTEEVEEEEEEEEEEDPVVTVKRFEFKGKKYLKTEDNVLYDADTQECVGVFNEKLQEIEECESDNEEEED